MHPVPFQHIGPRHPFSSLLETLRPAIAAMDRPCSQDPSIQAELKVVAAGGEDFRADRFYWSEQWRTAEAPFSFAARTLNWSFRDGGREVLAFPADPYLASAGPLMARWQAEGTRGRVLRYVPLRRLTVLLDDAARGPCIAKVKRRSRFAQAHDLIARVAAAAEQARVPVAVSRPLGIDPENAAYFQSLLPGRDLAEHVSLADTDTFERCGEVHGALHRLATAGLPRRTNRSWLEAAQDDWRTIRLYLPALAERLEPSLGRLAATLPQDPEPAFCHGDFVCSQVLVDGDAWAVTDFDLCHAGDPVRDAAMFLATLPFDAPAFRGREAPDADHPVGRAYLTGWARMRGAAPARARLAWHGLCATLYVLGLMLKKDRWEAASFSLLESRALRMADELGERA